MVALIIVIVQWWLPVRPDITMARTLRKDTWVKAEIQIATVTRRLATAYVLVIVEETEAIVMKFLE